MPFVPDLSRKKKGVRRGGVGRKRDLGRTLRLLASVNRQMWTSSSELLGKKRGS